MAGVAPEVPEHGYNCPHCDGDVPANWGPNMDNANPGGDGYVCPHCAGVYYVYFEVTYGGGYFYVTATPEY